MLPTAKKIYDRNGDFYTNYQAYVLITSLTWVGVIEDNVSLAVKV